MKFKISRQMKMAIAVVTVGWILTVYYMVTGTTSYIPMFFFGFAFTVALINIVKVMLKKEQPKSDKEKKDNGESI